jgi:hypothetical protein
MRSKRKTCSGRGLTSASSDDHITSYGQEEINDTGVLLWSTIYGMMESAVEAWWLQRGWNYSNMAGACSGRFRGSYMR